MKSLFYVCMLFSIASFAGTDCEPPITIGLVGYYPFCGNAHDATSYGNDGIVNDATLTTDRFGTPNSAYLFNGTSSNIDLGINAAINSISNDFTVSYWALKTSASEGNVIACYSADQGTWRIISMIGSGDIHGGYVREDRSWETLNTGPITLNQWMHVVHVRNGATFSTYINGTLSGAIILSSQPIVNPTSPPATTKIGYAFPSVPFYDYFTGKIDDIAFYNRALILPEIKALFEDGAYSVISGNVFGDMDNNCSGNGSDPGLKLYTISVANNYIGYTTTDNAGNYSIGVADTGDYTVRLRPNTLMPYWTPDCGHIKNVRVEDSLSMMDSVDFALRPTLMCPFNTVDISAGPPFRTGRQNTYHISYCNNGTVASPGTYVLVKLDPQLLFDSASIPYTVLPGNIYRFEIGSLGIQQCGRFSFEATLAVTTIIGQTICAEAHIYPDTICTVSNYPGAFIESGILCTGDSIRFQLYNKGGNMTASQVYRILENDTLRIQHNFQLGARQTMVKTIQALPGKTYRIIAEQPPGLPPSYGDKYTTAATENCNAVTNFNTGFFGPFPNYDAEPYRAVTCNEIIGSFDPNDKVAKPAGYSALHYIEPNTSIDYQVNFQNTGNDTAFKVVIVDTIAPTLDINSLQPGVSSHTYRFERIDSSVIRFVFDNILLVDSNTNEPLSHGFVKFKIQQKQDNAIGTKIYNTAAIYFDYNVPVITNRTYHTVGVNFIQVSLIEAISNPKFNIQSVKVFPNPFRDKTQVRIEGEMLDDPILLLVSIEGKIIKTISPSSQNTFEIVRDDLADNIYFYKILEDGVWVATGKLVIQ